MWEDYEVPGGTYRENMLRAPGQSSTTKGHASRKFTFEALKNNMDENGVITINRQDPEPMATNGLTQGEKSEVVKATV
jgi:hypothetical protein